MSALQSVMTRLQRLQELPDAELTEETFKQTEQLLFDSRAQLRLLERQVHAADSNSSEERRSRSDSTRSSSRASARSKRSTRLTVEDELSDSGSASDRSDSESDDDESQFSGSRSGSGSDSENDEDESIHASSAGSLPSARSNAGKQRSRAHSRQQNP